ncbi:RNA polymerase sigma-70 factor [Pedobacter nototheniae]|uniref:RNA polymerase sigma factor n=1 Tax=Pedobacter nototheniae TaxID=2488994 RepID=UPI00292D76D5|nr:RNA polymerase sigma-70 factor [Pedobacter nototheniae]
MALVTLSNEAELIKKVSQGDKRAFTILFNAHYKSLASYVFKLTESLEVAEEIVQDVFIKIWLKKESLEHIHHFGNYIFILSKNQTLNYLRKKANDELKFKTWEKEFEGENPEESSYEQAENFRLLIDKAIENLPPQQKKIYLLSREEKLKYEEIAKMLNISPETVKKHIYVASKAIKEYVKNHMDDIVLMILLSQIILL